MQRVLVPLLECILAAPTVRLAAVGLRRSCSRSAGVGRLDLLLERFVTRRLFFPMTRTALTLDLNVMLGVHL